MCKPFSIPPNPSPRVRPMSEQEDARGEQSTMYCPDQRHLLVQIVIIFLPGASRRTCWLVGQPNPNPPRSLSVWHVHVLCLLCGLPLSTLLWCRGVSACANACICCETDWHPVQALPALALCCLYIQCFLLNLHQKGFLNLPELQDCYIDIFLLSVCSLQSHSLSQCILKVKINIKTWAMLLAVYISTDASHFKMVYLTGILSSHTGRRQHPPSYTSGFCGYCSCKHLLHC